jgi:hypothetical protein
MTREPFVNPGGRISWHVNSKTGASFYEHYTDRQHRHRLDSGLRRCTERWVAHNRRLDKEEEGR